MKIAPTKWSWWPWAERRSRRWSKFRNRLHTEFLAASPPPKTPYDRDPPALAPKTNALADPAADAGHFCLLETLSSPGARAAYLSRRIPGSPSVYRSADRNSRGVHPGLRRAQPTAGPLGSGGSWGRQRSNAGRGDLSGRHESN